MRPSSRPRKGTPRRFTPTVERLEDRTVPIVGQYAKLTPAGIVVPGEFLAAPLTPVGQGYDGVVRIDSTDEQGTGSLIQLGTGQSWGHHILTAGHVLDPSADGLLTFQVPRGVASVDIPIPILAGNDYQVLPELYRKGTSTDIAIVRLADPIGVRSPSRLLVAPFGADRYGLVAANSSHLHQAVTIAGYGRSGDGEEGAIPAMPGSPPSRFFQPFGQKRTGVNQIDKQTLNQLFFDFDSGEVGAGQHDTLGGPDWGLAGPETAAGTLVPGPGNPPGPNVNLAKNGSIDISAAPGDSGGPFFDNNKLIAAVVLGTDTEDLSTKWGNVVKGNRVASWRPLIDLVATTSPNGGISYDVVLDMNYQVYGRSGAASAVGGGVTAALPDNITITASQVGGNLVLNVQGPDASMNGDYYSAPLANIKSLTIRGSDDNETIIIDGTLDFQGLGANKALTIVGRGGKDIIKINGLDSPGVFYGPVTIDGGAAAEGNELYFDDTSSATDNIYDVTGSYVTRRGLTQMNFSGFSKLSVTGGTGNNIFHTLGVPQTLKLGLAGGPMADDKLYVESGFLDDPTLTGFEHLFLSGGTLKLVTNNLSLTTFTQTGGTLDGAANVTVSKLMSWSGGTMQGAGRTEALAGSAATITGPVTLTTRRFVNAGAGTWAGTITGGGTLENAWSGTLDTTGGVTLAGDLDNNGSLRPAGTKAFGRVTVNGHFGNAGTLVVELGPEGDASDQVVAQTVTLSGNIDPYASQHAPADYYTVVVDQSAAGGGAFGNAPQRSAHEFNSGRYKMFYLVDNPTYWGKAIFWAMLSVRGRVWEDVNLDGLQFDRPLQGVAMELRKVYNGSDLWQPGDPPVTTYSGLDGTYQFTDVLVGGYVVAFINPDPDWWRFTLKDAGSDLIDSDADRGTGVSDGFTVSYTRGGLQPDAGLYKLGTIGNRVWRDYYVGGNGLQDNNEQGIGGLAVQLLDAQGVVVRATTTDYDGYYLFDKLELRDAGWAPIPYRVAFSKPADVYGGNYSIVYIFAPRDAGPDDLDSDADPSTGRTGLYTLNESGEVNSTVDCGIQQWMSSGMGRSASFDLGGEGEPDAVVAEWLPTSLAVAAPRAGRAGSPPTGDRAWRARASRAEAAPIPPLDAATANDFLGPDFGTDRRHGLQCRKPPA